MHLLERIQQTQWKSVSIKSCHQCSHLSRLGILTLDEDLIIQMIITQAVQSPLLFMSHQFLYIKMLKMQAGCGKSFIMPYFSTNYESQNELRQSLKELSYLKEWNVDVFEISTLTVLLNIIRILF